MGITLTFGEVAENHAGMQQIGEKAKEGMEKEDLMELKKIFKSSGFKVDVYDLKRYLPEEYHLHKGVVDVADSEYVGEALFMVVKNGIEFFDTTSEKVYSEQTGLEYDKKALMYGRVVNKKARYNLCFSEEYQAPDYESGKGTIIPYSDVPEVEKIRMGLNGMMEKLGLSKLKVEGNYYFNPKECGIGYHGDTERRIVIGLRVGESIPLAYRWYYNSEKISKTIRINLEEGDLYFMSHKATGNDWKLRSHVTLRHAAGEKFINVKPKEKK